MLQQPEFFHTEAAQKALLHQLRVAARGKQVLFHGTSLGSMIARTDTLLVPRSGPPVVTFTRSPEIAIEYATLPKDDDDGVPTVFVFDRRSLQSRYRIEPFQCAGGNEKATGKSEMEERVVWRDIRPMSRHLNSIFFCFGKRVFETTCLSRYSVVTDILARAKIAVWLSENGYGPKTSAV